MDSSIVSQNTPSSPIFSEFASDEDLVRFIDELFSDTDLMPQTDGTCTTARSASRASMSALYGFEQTQTDSELALDNVVENLELTQKYEGVGCSQVAQYPHQYIMKLCEARDEATALYKGLTEALVQGDELVLSTYPDIKAKIDNRVECAYREYGGSLSVAVAELEIAISSSKSNINVEVKNMRASMFDSFPGSAQAVEERMQEVRRMFETQARNF